MSLVSLLITSCCAVNCCVLCCVLRLLVSLAQSYCWFNVRLLAVGCNALCVVLVSICCLHCCWMLCVLCWWLVCTVVAVVWWVCWGLGVLPGPVLWWGPVRCRGVCWFGTPVLLVGWGCLFWAAYPACGVVAHRGWFTSSGSSLVPSAGVAPACTLVCKGSATELRGIEPGQGGALFSRDELLFLAGGCSCATNNGCGLMQNEC